MPCHLATDRLGGGAIGPAMDAEAREAAERLIAGRFSPQSGNDLRQPPPMGAQHRRIGRGAELYDPGGGRAVRGRHRRLRDGRRRRGRIRNGRTGRAPACGTDFGGGQRSRTRAARRPPTPRHPPTQCTSQQQGALPLRRGHALTELAQRRPGIADPARHRPLQKRTRQRKIDRHLIAVRIGQSHQILRDGAPHARRPVQQADRFLLAIRLRRQQQPQPLGRGGGATGGGDAEIADGAMGVPGHATARLRRQPQPERGFRDTI